MKLNSIIISKLNLIFQKEYHNLSLWYFVSLITGILIYFSLSFEPKQYPIVLIITLLVIINFTFKNDQIIRIFICRVLISMLIGILLGTIRTENIKPYSINNSYKSINFTGDILAVKPLPKGTQLTISVLEISLPQEEIKLKKMRINYYHKDNIFILSGDRIKGKCSINPLPKDIIPGGYSFERVAFFNEIEAIGNLHDFEIIKFSNADNFLGILSLVRKIIYDRLLINLGHEKGNFAAAIFLGETGGINRDILNQMRLSGISHLLCVSGLHLSIVAMFFFTLSRFFLNLFDTIALKYDVKKLSAFISLFGSFTYLLLTGTQIAATRAFIMTGIGIWAIIVLRTPYPLRSLAIAAAIILALNPEYIVNPSFQLSFVAVIALVSGYEFYVKNIHLISKSKGIFSSIFLYFVSSIYSSLAASLATAPIVVYHFYIFSSYSIIANLIAVPIVSFIIIPIGIITLILDINLLNVILYPIISYAIEIVSKTAKLTTELTYSVIYTGFIDIKVLLIYLFGLFWLVIWQGKIRLYSYLIFITALLVHFYNPKANYLINFENRIAAVRLENKISIYSPKISTFAKSIISNWFGSNMAENIKIPKNKSDIFCLKPIFSESECEAYVDFAKSKICNKFICSQTLYNSVYFSDLSNDKIQELKAKKIYRFKHLKKAFEVQN